MTFTLELANTQYTVGSPGMIASHSYKHTRQHVIDPAFTVAGAAKKLWFGTACFNDAGKVGDASAVGDDFIGVYVDPGKYYEIGYYQDKELATVLSMGDIWVRVVTNIVIKVFDKVSVVKAADAADNNIVGKFSNAAVAAGIIGVPNARFLTGNCGGIAVIGLSTWKGN